MKTLGFGKHRDTPLEDVPTDYLEWLLGVRKKETLELEAELERRELAELAEGSWKERLIKAGYRTLMKQHHPDTGGTDADAQQINAAFEALRRNAK